MKLNIHDGTESKWDPPILGTTTGVEQNLKCRFSEWEGTQKKLNCVFVITDFEQLVRNVGHNLQKQNQVTKHTTPSMPSSCPRRRIGRRTELANLLHYDTEEGEGG